MPLPPPNCTQAMRTSSVFSFWSLTYARDEAAFLHDFQRIFQRIMQARWQDSRGCVVAQASCGSEMRLVSVCLVKPAAA